MYGGVVFEINLLVIPFWLLFRMACNYESVVNDLYSLRLRRNVSLKARFCFFCLYVPEKSPSDFNSASFLETITYPFMRRITPSSVLNVFVYPRLALI